MFINFRWIRFVSKKMNRIEKEGRRSSNSFLSMLGIAFGVMALTVVMGVMNGFQMSFIDAILELTSYHVRVENIQNEDEFLSWCRNQKDFKSATFFYDSQTLMASSRGLQSPAVIRSIDFDSALNDEGFNKEFKIIAGNFDLKDEDSIVLGNTLARKLGVNIGSKVVLVAMSGSSDTPLVSDSRVFTVNGIFFTGYAKINEAYSFVNLSAGEKYFGKKAVKKTGIKLTDYSADSFFILRAKDKFPDLKISGWKEYNRSFFGALRIEKNILLLLILLIFVVVAVNIFNGMRKLVFERKAESAVLLSFGARHIHVQSVFMLQGFFTGLKGSVIGLLCGLLISLNMKQIFLIISKVMYYASYFFTMIFSPQNLSYVSENKMYSVYARIPARVFPFETVMIFLFGLSASLLASYFAGRAVLKLNAAEVLRDE